MTGTGTGDGWRKSSRCDGGACAEVTAAPGAVLVRDRSGQVLACSPAAWAAFTGRVKDGAA